VRSIVHFKHLSATWD